MSRLDAVARKYGELIRVPPKLKRHPLGTAYVAFKVRGRRVYRYFGPFGSRAAEVKYAAWLRRWPAQLTEGPPPGRWPAVRLLTFRGRTQSLAKWAAQVGLKATTLRNRLDVQKWTLERALTTPKQRPHFARRVR